MVGAGSVVVKDIPSHSVAAGDPCRVIRGITDKDKEYWRSKAEGTGNGKPACDAGAETPKNLKAESFVKL